MKQKIQFLLMAALFVGTCLGFTACGDDDDDDIVPPTPAVPQDVTLNATNFPDANFRAYVASITGVAEGEVISAEKFAAVTYIYVKGEGITSLKGIEYFTELVRLNCVDNGLTSLDLSKNTELKLLECFYNNLYSLNVSGCTALESIICYHNQLKGAQMGALIASMPTVSQGRFVVVENDNSAEGNVCIVAQVNAAKAKGWKVLDTEGHEYSGS